MDVRITVRKVYKILKFVTPDNNLPFMITVVAIIIAVVTISITMSVMLPRVTMVIVFWQVAIVWPQTHNFAQVTFL